MSFARFLYYSTVVGGWAAFVAWLPAQWAVLGSSRWDGATQTILTSALIGGAVSASVNLVSAAARGAWSRVLRRLGWGLVCGLAAGALGGWVGDWSYARLGVPRAVGWMIMGMGVGSAEGLFERNGRTLRNGLLGGGLGGLAGGFLFDLSALVLRGTSAAGVALGLVILGLAVGGLIGLAHVVLKEAWLTVLDGFRPGRQLVLTRRITPLGRGDHLPLPFLGYPGRDLETEHLLIRRTADGQYTVEDNKSASGTLLNGRRVEGPTVLRDGDLLRFGSNVVRFSQRRRLATPVAVAVGEPPITAVAPPLPRIPPPPPPPKRTRSGASD